jgi:hypothetical protein
VRITDENGSALAAVYLALTDAEARELRGALNDLLAAPRNGWHANVSDAEYQREITIYREDDPLAVQ